MSFGVGIGDIIKLTSLAWRMYKSYKDSSTDFARLANDILCLHAVLAETSEFLSENPTLDTSRRNRLSILCGGCQGVLEDLHVLYTKYDSLGTHAQRTWDRMRFGLGDLCEVRGRLVSSATLLTAWNVAVVNSSTSHINKKLSKFIAEVQAGLREDSIVTTPGAAQTIDSPDVWKELRRDLEDVGISAAVVEENRGYVVTRIKQAIRDGELAERCDLPARLPSVVSSRDGGALVGDSGYGGSESGFGRQNPSAALGLNMANFAFEEELRRQRDDWRLGKDGGFGGGGGGGGGGGEDSRRTKSASDATVTTAMLRRRTDPVGKLKKLFRNETDIIEAASDGDLKKVAKLVSLGMDVNARDQWGWSALSMCGYGGHRDIARLLLDHGADLDNVDVDGDTPTSLAAQRRHAELVIMFDDEREARDLRVREGDTEVPRRVKTTPSNVGIA